MQNLMKESQLLLMKNQYDELVDALMSLHDTVIGSRARFDNIEDQAGYDLLINRANRHIENIIN